MPNFRVLPPVLTGQQLMVISGRSYSGQPGVAMDVPDFDGRLLCANGWVFVAPSGPTSARPSPLAGKTPPYLAANGTDFFDVTIGKYIVYDGVTWRDPANGNAV